MITDSTNIVIFRQLGLQPYEPVWERMKAFTHGRDRSSQDEIWLLQHESVFTLGQAGESCHVHDAGDIPVIKCDRGGQVTYHGPGQLIAYLLIDLRRLGLGVKRFVAEVEEALIELLAELGIDGCRREKAPGVYVDGRKIAALGLRVRKNGCFHGLSLNLTMNLSPFSRINVCGYEGLEVTQVSDFIPEVNEAEVIALLSAHLINRLGYSGHETQLGWREADKYKG